MYRYARDKFEPGNLVRVKPSHGASKFRGDQGTIAEYVPFGKYYVELERNGRSLVSENDLEPLKTASYDRRKADGFPLHLPSKADSLVSQAYRDLVSFKSAMDRMEEIPGHLRQIYDETGRAISELASVSQRTHQVRELAKRIR